MLTNLLKVDKRVFQTAANGGHATESGTLELLALEQRLGVFNKTNIVAADSLNQVLCRANLSEGNTEMVRIVKSVHQILVWWELDPTPELRAHGKTYGRGEYLASEGIHRE